MSGPWHGSCQSRDQLTPQDRLASFAPSGPAPDYFFKDADAEDQHSRDLDHHSSDLDHDHSSAHGHDDDEYKITPQLGKALSERFQAHEELRVNSPGSQFARQALSDGTSTWHPAVLPAIKMDDESTWDKNWATFKSWAWWGFNDERPVWLSYLFVLTKSLLVAETFSFGKFITKIPGSGVLGRGVQPMGIQVRMVQIMLDNTHKVGCYFGFMQNRVPACVPVFRRDRGGCGIVVLFRQGHKLGLPTPQSRYHQTGYMLVPTNLRITMIDQTH